MEFASLGEIRARYGPSGVREPSGPLAITDDTQLTLFTAEGLVLARRAGAAGRPGELLRIVHRAYLRWLAGQGMRSAHASFEGAVAEGWLRDAPALREPRAPGATCLSALAAPRMGRAEHPLNQSKGCGGVMRVAPVGLALSLDDPFLRGCEIAALTHGHPSGFLAAGFLSAVIRDLVCGDPPEAAVAGALEELARCPGQEETRDAVERACALAREARPSAERVESLGEGWVAEEALAIGLYCALVAPDVPAGLRLAVNHGGDSDSTGCIAGQLLGAQRGAAALPGRWLGMLELREEIEAVAEALWGAFGAAPS